jgi:F-type H+-transporting ATPase subunit delta
MSQVSQRYARALFELAQAQGIVAEIAHDLSQLETLLNVEKPIAGFLKNKLTRQEDAVTALTLISTKLHFNKVTQNFLQVLILNRRLGKINQMIGAFYDLQEDAEGVKRGEIVTAGPLTAATKASFEKVLTQKMGRQIHLHENKIVIY